MQVARHSLYLLPSPVDERSPEDHLARLEAGLIEQMIGVATQGCRPGWCMATRGGSFQVTRSSARFDVEQHAVEMKLAHCEVRPQAGLQRIV